MERVGSNVARELGRFGTVSGLAPIVEAWPSAVGPEIARNAWPGRIGRDGTLHVHTSSSAWAFELDHLADKIRAALGEAAPRRIRFVVGPLPEPERETPVDPRRTPLQPTTEQRLVADRLASGISDENLRKVVAKTAAMSLAKADSDRSLW